MPKSWFGYPEGDDLGRYPEGENGNPFQYSCLENYMDRGSWWACKELDTTGQVVNCFYALVKTHCTPNWTPKRMSFITFKVKNKLKKMREVKTKEGLQRVKIRGPSRQ